MIDFFLSRSPLEKYELDSQIESKIHSKIDNKINNDNNNTKNIKRVQIR